MGRPALISPAHTTSGGISCIYPVEAPGGLQLYGLTLPTWDAYRQKPGYSRPWLLEPFDRIQFFEVGHDEFERIQRHYDSGRYEFKIVQGMFDVSAYATWFDSIASETSTYVAKRDSALERMSVLEDEQDRLWQRKQALTGLKQEQELAGKFLWWRWD